MTKETVVFHGGEDQSMKSIAMLIQISSDFACSIYIEKDGRRANAKSLLGVLSLGINNGDEIDILADGQDEKEAVEKLKAYISDVKR
ncbi:MAG: HPr family phosphocarrier protein [Clostridiaceae bacterium]|jgi:phosphotransferase system HPr (HPr) family protein|nr:HPr family phosphocarrier protein [Clostridiaceae bacterium]